MSQSQVYPHTIEFDPSYLGVTYEDMVSAMNSVSQSPMLHPSPPSPPPLPQGPNKEKVPRPPNAFLMFRSDVLKRNLIPSNVEHRQQDLSKIVGEAWNLLKPHEKGLYQEMARQALDEHKRKYPDYKFTPAPRGSKRSKAKVQEGEKGANDAERRKYVRETYLNVRGPAIVASRKKKRNTKEHRVSGEDTQPAKLPSQYPSPLSPSMHNLTFPDQQSHFPISATAGVSNMNTLPIQQPMPSHYYQSGRSTDLIRRPSTTGGSRDLYANSTLFDHASSDSLGSVLCSPPSVRPRKDLPQGLDFNVPAAATPAHYFNLEPLGAALPAIGAENYSAFGSNHPFDIPFESLHYPNLHVGFNGQQQQVLMVGGSESSAGFFRPPVNVPMGFDGYDFGGLGTGVGDEMTEEVQQLMESILAEPFELGMSTPSPAASAGSSQF